MLLVLTHLKSSFPLSFSFLIIQTRVVHCLSFPGGSNSSSSWVFFCLFFNTSENLKNEKIKKKKTLDENFPFVFPKPPPTDQVTSGDTRSRRAPLRL
jgi:hypothetical protein